MHKSRGFFLSGYLLMFLILSAVSLSLPTQGLCAESVDLKIDLTHFFAGHEAAFVIYDFRDDEYVRFNPERCKQRFSPCSIFKIPNSLIALETGIASDANCSFKWDGISHPIETWNCDQTLKSAFSESCVWVYRDIAARVGTETMKKFIDSMDYGNKDISGGLKQFWLESSLKISPDEQVEFIKKLCTNKLLFSARSVQTLKEIMVATQTADVTVYGKTGTSGDLKKGVAFMGWYVGFVEKADRKYVFAANFSGGDNPSGRHLRKVVFEILHAMKLL